MAKCLTYLSAILLCLVSCNKEPKNGNGTPADTRAMSIDKTEYTADYHRSSFAVKVNANFTYNVTIGEEWITEDNSSSSSERRFSIAENTGKAERSTTIRFQDASDRYYYKEMKVKQEGNPVERHTMHIVDKNATPQTKALFANLYAIPEKGWMFGHHDDLWYGRYWYNEPGNSDTKAVCGDYPGVFSVDVAPFMDDRHNDKENDIRRRVMLEARERGELIIACAHLNNPKTGKDSWDNSDKTVVKDILTEGSSTRKKYQGWLDNLATFANNLRDSKGDLVPMVLRIYHEHTQSWSWWGSSCTTDREFLDLWQFTVKYLRDNKGVHNFLYAVSPQMDESYSDTKGRLLFRWPGDEYVDFIGIDCYQGLNPYVFGQNVKALADLSIEKKKPCGVTETGLESFANPDYWTKYILEPVGDKRISLVTMWRNKYVSSESDKHYFSVYPGHPSEDDFRKMYNDKRTLFSKDLPDMYNMPEGYEIK